MEHAGRARICAFSDYDGTISTSRRWPACLTWAEWPTMFVVLAGGPLGKAGVIAGPNITPGV
jgi:hypothetical protein